jgi:hypothetical protein
MRKLIATDLSAPQALWFGCALGTKDFLEHDVLGVKRNTLPRSRWLTGADLSDTWHEILGAHVIFINGTTNFIL